jgi:hypothetical protein
VSRPTTALALALTGLVVLSVQRLSGASTPASCSRPETVALDRLFNSIERPPVAYQALRRLEASSAKLSESAWMDAFTQYDPAIGFRYRILGQGGSNRIFNQVLKPVLEAERENAIQSERRKGAINRENYDFNVDGDTADGLIKVTLNPRRRDSRLVQGVALLSAQSGDLVRLQGRLSRSPSFWVRWVDITRRYTRIRGAMLPVAVESVANVKIAGVSTFSMRYEYVMVDGQNLAPPQILASR